jgi:4-hydroxy-tetrahydrodipicolinate reductase
MDYDVAIIDEHHRMKKDSPSGTAKILGDAVRQGNGGRKMPQYAAIRAGHIIGEHEVIFTGNGETIRLRHSVTDRGIFARGALDAALWLHKKPAGFYGMDDVLGI